MQLFVLKFILGKTIYAGRYNYNLMATKKAKKKVNNSKYLVPGVVVVAIIVVILILFSTPNPIKQDCNYYCKETGFTGAVNSNCAVFTQCMAPNYPLTGSVIEKYCDGDFDVCCCKQ